MPGMTRRTVLKVLGALLVPFGVRPVFAKAPVHDFTTDEGLRVAIESIFKDVDPVQSMMAWENRDYPHVTFAMCCATGNESKVRESLYNAVLHNAAKEQGSPMAVLNDKSKATMVWRMTPTTKLDYPAFPENQPYIDGRSYSAVRMRLSWWVR